MKILFCNPPSVMLMGECGGVRRLMYLYEEALKIRGVQVDYLPQRQSPDWHTYDAGHLFMANGESFSLGMEIKRHLPLIVSPIIDKLYPLVLIRMNVLMDRLLPFFYTHLGKCAALCQLADSLCLMSTEEGRLARQGLGVTTGAAVVHAPVFTESFESASIQFATYAQKPYILFLGDAGNPRKNVPRLLQAVKQLDIELLIGGIMSPGKTASQVQVLLSRTPNARYLGKLSDSDKNFLLRHAQAFVLPSLLEGIGLAAVEAGLLGTTIVITEKGGPPDYFADKAYYVNPRSVGDIRHKILCAMKTPMDASVHLRQFTHESTGGALETCYQNAISNETSKGQQV